MRLVVRGILPLVVVFMLSVGGAFLPPADEEAKPDVYHVGENGFAKISEALAVAKGGDIIKVGPGIWDEPVDINKSVTIKGMGPDTLITSTWVVSTNGVTLKDNTYENIYDNSTPHDWDFGGIVTRQTTGDAPDNSLVSGLTVTGCEFRNCRQGIFLFGAKDSTVQNCDFYNCYRGITIRGHYINNNLVWTSSGNTVKDCNFYNSLGSGIDDGEAVAIFESDDNVVDSCTMDGNSYGVHVYKGTGNQVTGCTITDSTHEPISLDSVTGLNSLSVTSNTVRSNGKNVLMRNCNGVTFNSNTLRGNGGPIDLEGSSTIVFNGNTINGSSVYLNGSKSCSFASNVFEVSGEPSFVFKEGLAKDYYDHTIAASNTVGGRAIHHDHDNGAAVISGADAGAVYLTYCPDAQVTTSRVRGGDGVWVYMSERADIQADVTNCLRGIEVVDSDDTTLTGCDVNASTRGWNGVHIASGHTGGAAYNCTVAAPGTGPAFRVDGSSDFSTYNCTFDYDDVNASDGSLFVYNLLDIKVWDNGTVDPLPGVHVHITRDDVTVYATPHFNGVDAVTDAGGEVLGIVLLDRDYIGSDTATRHVHNVTVHKEIDAIWTDGANDIDMSGPLSLVFEAADIRAPMSPFGFAVTTVPEEDSIKVSWSPNADDTQVYSVYTNMTGDWALIENITGSELWIREGLVHATMYWFAVSAWDEVPLESPWSAFTSVVHVDGVRPAAPTGLAETGVGGTNVSMEWDAHQEADVEGYIVYVEEGPGTWRKVAGPLTGTTLTIEDLDSETTYRFVVTALDEVPNESPHSEVLEITTLDITPPDPPELDVLPRYTNKDPYTVTGTAEPGSTVTIFVGGGERATGIANESGGFAIELDLDDGLNLITAWATDGVGNTGALSPEARITLDQLAPDMPVLDELPELTNVVELTVTGTVEPLCAVTVLVNGEQVLVLKTEADGAFSVTFDLTEGENVIAAFATDDARNVGPTAERTVVLDTIAPEAPVLEAMPEYTNEEDHTLAGTAEPGSHVLVVAGGDVVAETDADGGGAWSVDIKLSPGENVLVARARDLVGNTGEDSEPVTIVLDQEDPVADAGVDVSEIEGVGISLDASGSSDNEGIDTYLWTFTWDGVDLSFEGETLAYTFDEVATVTVTLTVTDLAGNTGTDNVVLDILTSNVAPVLSKDQLTPDKGTTATEFTFTVTYSDENGDPGEVLVWIDGEAFIMVPDPDDTDTTDGRTYTFTTRLDRGEHSYYFTGRDVFGEDAGGPSAGDGNAKTSPDVAKKKTKDTPGLGAWVALAALVVSLVALEARRRGG